ncbi:hypothetical protein A9Q89_11880 [Gammaproteobacteria bacterium 53_120_T64]|mgnify:CR=1 FL=1|nr:hypothetical protein A9Q89_11880 [Gammaproteobacteria bacterium 53_120_T64]
MHLHHACRNTLTALACLLSLIFSNPALASIDAQCERISTLLIQQLNAENLIRENSAGQGRIKEIALSLCAETQQRVEEQHQEDKAKALENWFFESHPEKPGNRRLKTKR